MIENTDTDSSGLPAIAARQLELKLAAAEHQVEILKGIDLHITTGSKIGLIGPSGSGKTSLLTLLAGLQKPTAGTLSVLGTDYQQCSQEQLASFRRSNIGVVFQNFHLLPSMNAVENVALPLEMASDPAAEEKAAESLAVVGLSHRLDHFPHQLSGGEQQRVAIARAFVARPRLILADEPTGNLDGETGNAVIGVLDKLVADSGATLIFITHDNSLLSRFDQTLKMLDGRLIDDSGN
ncbi:MAG: ABC transporter ATP-binding protein [Betaproteobacteria bacterium]|nr:ABC transporter ATP-binding protein [Betaproteobacteria bacterium]